jgi:hypothetical protein
VIPRGVRFIDRSVFHGVAVSSIFVERGNERFGKRRDSMDLSSRPLPIGGCGNFRKIHRHPWKRGEKFGTISTIPSFINISPEAESSFE